MGFFKKQGQNILALLFLLSIAGLVVAALHWKSKDAFLEYIYDIQHENATVKLHKDIDKIINSYAVMPFSALDKRYLKYTRSNSPKYEKMLSNCEYLIIPREDINKKIVGDFKIKHFMCKDKYYKDGSHQELVWLVDKRLLYKTLDLLNTLESQGYNKDGFYIQNAHRHPTYNEKIKGASKSRHIRGEAVDIIIRDINDDGKATQKDKTIVYNLLNKEIIRNDGGIGRYPGTMNLHYDVRGSRARWDSF